MKKRPARRALLVSAGLVFFRETLRRRPAVHKRNSSNQASDMLAFSAQHSL
ncbi:MAG: hypothetical protein KGR46_11230 [Verrucomicrobia bacterium]|nr:hypothetical protein [Verrucomicrobiota bacterium]